MATICGYRVHERALRDAPFVCPRCGLDRVGTEIEPQRWWTVRGHRVVPLATYDRIVECCSCGHRCDAGAMEIPTTEMLARYLNEATRAAAVVVVRAAIETDAELTPAVAAAAVAAIRDADHSYDEADLHDDLALLDPTDASIRVGRLRAELTAHGKQGFLRRMSAIAVSTGQTSTLERRAIVEIGMALGMAAPHINGVLAVAELQAA